ncbi:WD40-like beta-propeller protein [Chondrocystis sp. NIES-4102]|nr:WD40-like beta-propeller protein [Chondrocystis sp. NIES-4102]
MFGINKGKVLLQPQWQGNLSEYITVLAWSPSGILAASSAAGEVVLWQDGNLINILGEGLASIDCLAFSFDGKFLAAGGQDGKVRIWEILSREENRANLVLSLDNAPSWIDKLAYHPTCNQLAFSLGRYVQIWAADTQTVITTLPFANSSVLDLAWQPNGENIALAGDGGVKIWDANNWDDDPYVMEMPSASIVTAWSSDSKYIASGNLDNTITVLEYGSSYPWVMQGFPGKISNLTWSSVPRLPRSQQLSNHAPILAASSMENIAVWKKAAQDEDGWNANVLNIHEGKIQALKFHPHSMLLASAADDGLLVLWTKAKQIGQILEGAKGGFSCLAWSGNGCSLAGGGQNGELLIWSESKRGKGFG